MLSYVLNGSSVTMSWLLLNAAELNLIAISSSDEYLNLFLNECNKPVNDSVFIIDISCSLAIEEMTRILRLTSIISRPRIILLSSILTWGGVSISNVTDTTKDFSLRKPFSWCFNEYLDENGLWETVKSVGSELFVISSGLVYGNSGYDFDAIFNQIWMSATTSDASTEYEIVTSIENGSNSVPMIHFNDYLALLKYLISCSCDNSMSKMKYVLASDGTKVCINDILNHIKSNGQQFNIKYNYDKEYLIESIIKDKRQLLWSSNVISLSVDEQLPGFKLQYNQGLLKQYDELWSTYLSSHNLSPCSIIITGSPWSGKTCISQLMASTLKLSYVDINIALKYLLFLSSDTYLGMHKEMFESVRNEIVNIIEAKVNENKKPGKKGEEVPPTDLNNIELNDSIISSIDAKLLRQTVAIYLNNYSTCKLKGYILDVWQSGIIDSQESIYELITWNSEQLAGNINSVETIFEINVTDDILLKRFMDMNSISDDPKAKLSKDQQVILDKFKSTISNYSSKYTKIEKIENEVVISINSHPIIVDIETSNITKGFNRIDINNDNSSLDIQSISNKMIEYFFKIHGRMGWPTDYISLDVVDSGLHVNAEIIGSDTFINSENSSFNIDDSPFGSLMKINNQLGTLSGDDQITLLNKCNRLELFLQATILKPLSSGFINIARDKPSDPIKYLADYLLNESQKVEMQSENDNREFFFRVLDENNVNI